MRADTYGGQKLKAKTLKTRLFAQRVLVIPIIWPFETASSRLTGQAKRIVKGAAHEIDGAHTVTCIGYTDSRGGWKYNMALGLHRAKSVCRALRHLGVHAHPKAVSRGKAEPRATNGTAAGRARNRRVEIRVSYRRPRRPLKRGGGVHARAHRAHGHGGGHHSGTGRG